MNFFLHIFKHFSRVLFLVPAIVAAQSIERQVINSTGASSSAIPNFTIDYNVGEPVIATGISTSNHYTMGFMQPDIVVNAVFSLNVFTSGESCVSANDAYISVVPLNATGTVHYLWSPGGDTTSMIAHLQAGTYVLIATDSTGNTVVDTFNLFASSAPCEIDTIYNGISPNGDGKNEYFHIPGIEGYADNSVYIYNRYGNEVWSADNYNNTTVVFAGKDKNGFELPEGTYFYIINYGGKTRKSWIELIR